MLPGPSRSLEEGPPMAAATAEGNGVTPRLSLNSWPCGPWTQLKIRGQGTQEALFPAVGPLDSRACKEQQRMNQEVGEGIREEPAWQEERARGRNAVEMLYRQPRLRVSVLPVLPEVKDCVIKSFVSTKFKALQVETLQMLDPIR